MTMRPRPATVRAFTHRRYAGAPPTGVPMIEETLQRWHQYLAGDLPGGLDELLHDDVVFLSPIVFSPQRGKELTKRYLQAAGSTPNPKSFHYVKEASGGSHAFLEFETYIGDTYVNGIDIITCDDDGKIVEFKVMIRPLQAVNLVQEQMRAMLEQMQAAEGTP
jgi:hypothetical protein